MTQDSFTHNADAHLSRGDDERDALARTGDNINHPAHYTRGKYEPIDVIEDWNLGFHLGNTVKYIARAGHKDPSRLIEDLKKARWYLDRHIASLDPSNNRTSSSLDLVREFHERFGQSIADEPNIGDNDLNTLRCGLIREELAELAEALSGDGPVAVLDALTDLQYVLDGAYLQLGFHAVKGAALAEVHRSNMSKLGDDGKPVLREDGKILKGPNYSPPDLRSVLKQIAVHERFDVGGEG